MVVNLANETIVMLDAEFGMELADKARQSSNLGLLEQFFQEPPRSSLPQSIYEYLEHHKFLSGAPPPRTRDTDKHQDIVLTLKDDASEVGTKPCEHCDKSLPMYASYCSSCGKADLPPSAKAKILAYTPPECTEKSVADDMNDGRPVRTVKLEDGSSYQAVVRDDGPAPPKHLLDIMEAWQVASRRIAVHEERVLGAAAASATLIPTATIKDRTKTRRGTTRQRTELKVNEDFTPAFYEKCKNHMHKRAKPAGYRSIAEYACNDHTLMKNGKTWRENLPADQQSLEALRFMDKVYATGGVVKEKYKPQDVREQQWPQQFHLHVSYGKAGEKLQTAMPLAKNPMTKKFAFYERTVQERAGIPAAERTSVVPKAPSSWSNAKASEWDNWHREAQASSSHRESGSTQTWHEQRPPATHHNWEVESPPRRFETAPPQRASSRDSDTRQTGQRETYGERDARLAAERLPLQQQESGPTWIEWHNTEWQRYDRWNRRQPGALERDERNLYRDWATGEQDLNRNWNWWHHQGSDGQSSGEQWRGR